MRKILIGIGLAVVVAVLGVGFARANHAVPGSSSITPPPQQTPPVDLIPTPEAGEHHVDRDGSPGFTVRSNTAPVHTVAPMETVPPKPTVPPPVRSD